mmetsp:Transcript_12799/g.29203  ORF Transcript_12799/g.29203 Transcript_12799/m.29203 type:complete len:300 (+) Transcript_12799:267-1166(+)
MRPPGGRTGDPRRPTRTRRRAERGSRRRWRRTSPSSRRPASRPSSSRRPPSASSPRRGSRGPLRRVPPHLRRRVRRHGPLRLVGRDVQPGHRVRPGRQDEAHRRPAPRDGRRLAGGGGGARVRHGRVQRAPTAPRDGPRDDGARAREHRPVRGAVHVPQAEVGGEHLGGRGGRGRPARDGVDGRGGVGARRGGAAAGLDAFPLAVSPLLRPQLDVSRRLQEGRVRDGGGERPHGGADGGADQEVCSLPRRGALRQRRGRRDEPHVRHRRRAAPERVRPPCRGEVRPGQVERERAEGFPD